MPAPTPGHLAWGELASPDRYRVTRCPPNEDAIYPAWVRERRWPLATVREACLRLRRCQPHQPREPPSVCWAGSRDGSGRLPLWKGLMAYALATVLPDALFNTLIARLHRGPRADNPNPAYGAPAGAAADPVTQP